MSGSLGPRKRLRLIPATYVGGVANFLAASYALSRTDSKREAAVAETAASSIRCLRVSNLRDAGSVDTIAEGLEIMASGLRLAGLPE